MIVNILIAVTGLVVAANIGVCLWSVLNNAPHTFAASGCIAVVLGVNIANELERRGRKKRKEATDGK